MKQLASVFALLLLLAALVPSARAADPLSVVNTSTETRFAQEIRFRLQARSTAGTIQRITLSYVLGRARSTAYGYLTFQPGPEVQGEFSLKTGGSNYIPPGAKIRYYYVVEDSAGNRLQTEPQMLTYEDTRFQWSEVSRGLITVRYYGNGKDAAEQVLQAALQTDDRARQIAGVKLTDPVTVLIYNSKTDMDPALPFQSETSQRELVTLGETHAEYDLILMLGQGGSGGVAETTVHEFMHLITRQATDNSFSDIPIWLNEGLSTYVQGKLADSDPYLQALRQLIQANRVPPLRSLSSRPGKPDEEIAFYGQAYSVVKFLIESYGPDKMRILLATIKQGKTIDEALQVAYGLNIDGIDNHWRASMGLAPLPTPAPNARSNQPQAIPTLVPFGVTPPASAAEPAKPSTGPTPQPAASQPAPPSLAVVFGAVAVGVGILLLGAVGGVIVWLARKTRD